MAEPSDFPSSPAPASTTARLAQARVPLWLVLLVAVLLLALLGWQRLAMHRAEAGLATERQAMSRQFEADRSALLDELRAKVAANRDEAKREFGMALAWAVRGEMIRNNLDQVDQFFGEIVKLPHTERVLLADADGTVRVSTDRRHLGAALTTLVPVEATLADKVEVRVQAEGGRLLVIPIMGLNSRLGTVVVSYRQPEMLAGD